MAIVRTVVQLGLHVLTLCPPKHKISHIACEGTHKQNESRSSFEHWPEALEPSNWHAQGPPGSSEIEWAQCMWFVWRGRTSFAKERALSCTTSRARNRDDLGLKELSTAVRAGLPRAVMLQEQYPNDFVAECGRQLLVEPAS